MSKVGNKYFGRVEGEVRGLREWNNQQNHEESWTDNGDVRKAFEKIIPEMEKIVARNAHMGAAEYLARSECALRCDEAGNLFIGARIWNDEATMILDLNLRDLFFAAIQDMGKRIGVDPEAQRALSQLKALGMQLSQLGNPKPPPQPSGQSTEKQIAERFASARGRASKNV